MGALEDAIGVVEATGFEQVRASATLAGIPVEVERVQISEALPGSLRFASLELRGVEPISDLAGHDVVVWAHYEGQRQRVFTGIVTEVSRPAPGGIIVHAQERPRV